MKSEGYAEIIDKIKGNDWINFKVIGIDRYEAALILEVLEKKLKESERRHKAYMNNSEELKRKSSERYYANKAKISQERKEKYIVSKLEVFRK